MQNEMDTNIVKGGNDAINGYLFRTLFPVCVDKECPRTINVQRGLEQYLRVNNLPPHQAEENSIQWSSALTYRLESKCKEWEMLGVPRPIARSETPQTYITWKHPRYKEITGLTPLPSNFAPVAEWLDGLSSKMFLVACALLLKLCGANPIYVTDGPGDEGIDCIGRIEKGPLRSLTIYIQAKTSDRDISRDTLLMEYGKYLALPHSKRYQFYRRILNVDSYLDGVSSCYMIVGNKEFQKGAREIATSLGIMLRSRIQLINWLCRQTTVDKLRLSEANIKCYLGSSIDTNIANLIHF